MLKITKTWRRNWKVCRRSGLFARSNFVAIETQYTSKAELGEINRDKSFFVVENDKSEQKEITSPRKIGAKNNTNHWLVMLCSITHCFPHVFNAFD
jgi:hypothetical protein